MPTKISPLAEVDPRAELGEDVEIGPFCLVGPRVTIGDGSKLDSHVAVVGQTTLGKQNRLYPGAVIGAEPQDVSYRDSDTRTVIGDDNIFREGVTVNRGAEKEDGVTRIGDGNMLMANCHVAHNCRIHNRVILVNGVLLGGHVHVHDGGIVSGNSVVHHFSTLGTLSFVSGGCRVPHDVPPYMLAAGSDDPTIKNINVIGMRRAGIPEETIRIIKQAYRLLYREHKSLDEVQTIFCSELNEVFPYELSTLLDAVERQRAGKMGRARDGRSSEAASPPGSHSEQPQRRAA